MGINRNGKVLAIYVPNDLHRKVSKVSKQRSIPVSFIVRRALIAWVEADGISTEFSLVSGIKRPVGRPSNKQAEQREPFTYKDPLTGTVEYVPAKDKDFPFINYRMYQGPLTHVTSWTEKQKMDFEIVKLANKRFAIDLDSCARYVDEAGNYYTSEGEFINPATMYFDKGKDENNCPRMPEGHKRLD